MPVLIGREAELERVQRALDTARAGGSDVVVLRGQPGIGKTALLRAAIERAGGMTVLRMRGLEGEAELPFAGLAELCQPVLGLRDRLPEAQAAALAGALELEPAAPQARLAIGAALLGLLSLAAEECPVLCVVDDLQWLDEPSLEAMRFAGRRLGADGVAVLLAQRADVPDAAPGVETLELGPLAPDSALELLQAGRSHPVPELVARRVLDTAAGNPLALLEIPALLSRAELEGRAPVEGPLPPGSTLERVLARRLEGLDEDTRRALLVVAAAEARRGDVVLGALAAAGVDVSALESAESAGIVTLAPGEVGFRHPLLRAAAYHGATAVARRDAHRAVARALPEDDPQRAWQLAAGATRPDEVAAASERRPLGAGAHRLRPRRARAPARRRALAGPAAARAAAGRGGARPAPGRASGRRAGAARAGRAGARCGGGLGRLRHRHRAADAARPAALRTGRTAEARELLRAQARRLHGDEPAAAAMLLLLSSLGAMALRDHLGWLADAERALELAGDVELLSALAMLSAGAARMTVPDVAAGRRLLEEGERRLGDLGLALSLAPEIVALAAHGWLWIEEYERGVQMLDRLVAAGRESSSVGALPYPLAARAQGNLSLGRYRRALADAEEAVALAEQTGQDPALVIALGMLALVHGWRGDEAAAVAAADRANAVAERRNVPLPAIYARYALALLAGTPEEAVDRLEAMRAEALPGNVLWAPHLVDAYLRAGRRDDAEALVEHYARTIENIAGSRPPSSSACAA